MKRIILASSILALLISFPANSKEELTAVIDKPIIPDQETAVQVARIILKARFGAVQISEEEPFIAVLKNDIWIIDGSVPEGWAGGTAHLEISKATGEVKGITHYQ